MKSAVYSSVVLFIGLCCSPSTLFAVDTFLNVDQPRTVASMTGGTDRFSVFLSQNRSYCCTVSAASTVGSRFGTVSGLGQLIAVDRGKDDPPANADGSNLGVAGRKCFLAPTGSSSNFANISLPVAIGLAGTSTAQDVTGICEETSLLGGYNTSVTDFNFLEVSVSDNIVFPFGGATINGVLLLRDVINNVNKEASFSVTTNSSNGLGRVDINIHDFVGNQSFGPIIINHDGPPGSVNARLVQYNILSANPFSFEPVLEQAFAVKGTRH